MWKYQQKSKNTLLVRCEIGKSKPATIALPAADFAYGKACERDEFNAKMVLKNWGVINRRTT